MLVFEYVILILLILEVPIIGILSNINRVDFLYSPFKAITSGVKSHLRSYRTLIKFKPHKSYVVKSSINLNINSTKYTSIIKEHKYYVHYLNSSKIEILEIDDGFYNASIRTWVVKHIEDKNLYEVSTCEDEIEIKMAGSLTYMILYTLFFIKLSKIKCDEFSSYKEMNEKLKSEMYTELLKLIRDNNLEKIIN